MPPKSSTPRSPRGGLSSSPSEVLLGVGLPGTAEERDRNRKLLAELAADFHPLEQTVLQMQQVQAQMQQQLEQELQQMQTQMQQMQTLMLRELPQRVQHEVQQKVPQMVQEMKIEFKEQLRQELMQDYERKLEAMKAALKDEIRPELKAKKKDDIRPRPEHGGETLQARVDTISRELEGLVKKLEDHGLFKPPLPEMPEDSPAVGTICLDEDIYTTRLLMRLGFMRGVFEKGLSNENSSDSDDSSLAPKPAGLPLLNTETLENIYGLNVPDVEVGSKSYFTVTRGWAAICTSTALMQFTILAIFIKYGRIGDAHCIEHQTDVEWWLLHMSKALAVLVAGATMGQEFMGIVNYWLISDLLEAERSFEVIFTAFFQFGLLIALVVSTVFIFLTLSSPVDVWMNMTALTFVSGLDADVLSVAKQGLFGHSMAKCVGEVNYELTFQTEYPRWFPRMRGVAAVITSSFVLFCGAYVFLQPDYICE